MPACRAKWCTIRDCAPRSVDLPVGAPIGVRDGDVLSGGERSALDDSRAATAWTADIITGTDLAAAVRILSAIPVARSASESAVHLAQGGTTLAGLLLVTGEENRSTNPASFRRWLAGASQQPGSPRSAG